MREGSQGVSMRRALAWGGVLMVAVGLVAATGCRSRESARPAAAQLVPWERNLDAALERAGSENKLVMVDFYTDWCRWCRRLDQNTLGDANVLRALAHVVPVRLNAEKDGREVAARFRVDGYPTIVFLNASGAEVGRIPGYMEAGPFLEELEEIFKRG
jgi:thiol:disulfide interchange protein